MEAFERIRQLRKDKLKLTQEEFSSKINISRSNLGNIETGSVSLTDRVILDICDSFSVNEKWIRYGTGSIFTSNEISTLNKLSLEYHFDNFEYALFSEYLTLDSQERSAIVSYLKKVVKAICDYSGSKCANEDSIFGLEEKYKKGLKNASKTELSASNTTENRKKKNA